MPQGVDELFKDLVAPLVGIDPVDFYRIPWHPGDDVPVVLLEGAPGMGKTATLDRIAECYRDRVPIARVDLADQQRYPEDTEDGLPRLLTDLRWRAPWGLSLAVRGNGRALRFPRLSVALLAIAAGPPSDRLDDQQARQHLQSALSRVYPQVEGQDAADWVGEVISELAARMAPFPADVLIKATVMVVARRLFGRSRRNAALGWHKDHSRGPGDGLDALIALSTDFRREGLPRKRTEEALVAALLEDVRSEYHGPAYLRRGSRPVVLLDNAEAHPAGERFLDLVLDHRSSGTTDPLVVIAASEKGLLDRHHADATPTTSRFPLAVGTWERQAGGTAGAGLIVVGLSALEEEHVLTMLRGVHQPNLERLIHRLTGGLPLGVEAITDALVAAGERAGEAPCFYDLPRADDSQDHVASRVLRHLVPSENWRSRLITLSAARDAAAAAELLPRQTVHDGNQFLRRHGWTPSPEQPAHFVGDRFLRHVLLHGLYRRDAGQTWTRTHQRLRDFHARHGGEPLGRHDARRLHHCLALGDVGTVVDRLEEGVADAARWLEALCVISEAPYFDRPDTRAAAARGAEDFAADEPTERLIRRILYALWYLRDPFVPPDKTLIKGLGYDLRQLANKDGIHGTELLRKAADSWCESLRSWQQDLRPPRREE